MPFALIIVGAVMLIAAVRGTEGDLYGLLWKDFTGPNNFIFWVAAILAIGFLGYIPRVKPISVALLGLVMLVLVLNKGEGFFDRVTSGLSSTEKASVPDMQVGVGTPSTLPKVPTLPGGPAIWGTGTIN